MKDVILFQTPSGQSLCINHAICAVSVGIPLTSVPNYNSCCYWCSTGNPPKDVVEAMKEKELK